MEEIKKFDTEHLTMDNYVNMIGNEVEALRRIIQAYRYVNGSSRSNCC